ncbi:MAG: hypothetical protein RMJ55_02240 [Roseiflexaceae bacterium]|nr:hypothetical protein [Roseiflexus sp.]MDW8212350.1 hypothetical protein [Roseiflexaceae bacterium]
MTITTGRDAQPCPLLATVTCSHTDHPRHHQNRQRHAVARDLRV